MFAYCLNNPSSYADAAGRDAIYVTNYTVNEGLPFLGHATLYIQDSDGTWYFTEFAFHTVPSGKKITVSCWEANYEDVEPYLNGDVSSLSTKSVYLEGDYTNSLALAQSYDGTNYGGYNPRTNNCLHYVLEILRAGTCNNQCVQKYIQSSNSIIPHRFGKKLKAVSKTVKSSVAKSSCTTSRNAYAGFKCQIK